MRPLAQLESQQQVEVWQRAVQQAGGKVPSARIVTDVVQRIMERTRVPNTYQLGEVCQIFAKDNPELRGKGGCWCEVKVICSRSSEPKLFLLLALSSWCEVKVICSRSSEPLAVVTMHFNGLRTSN